MGAADRLSRVITSTPIDRKANTVTGRGSSYEPSHPFSEWWLEQPPIFPPTKVQLIDPNFQDLTGRKYGHMKVVGFSGKGGRWVCRCVCGRYEMRKASTIRAQRRGDSPNVCSVCNNAERVRNGRPSYLKPKTDREVA